MAAGKRDLVSIDDLGKAEVLDLFRHADAFHSDLTSWGGLCRDMVMAAMFFEPSTRTRLSFESAMLRLGGGVITAAEGASTSKAKGESLADTARVVGGGYSDILVVRHPDEGAAQVAADHSRVPVINGGDGAHEHPTQTLCDLYTLHKRRGDLRGMDIALCGDLLHSRTIPSFAYALARFGANILTLPYPGMEMPQHVLDRLARDHGMRAVPAELPHVPELVHNPEAALYLSGAEGIQADLFSESRPWRPERLDALYMTRAQRERHNSKEAAAGYPRLNRKVMAHDVLRDTIVLHPLPRVDEIHAELDSDPRAAWFEQTEFGVPVRMALIAFLLGRIELRAEAPRVGQPEAWIRPIPGALACTNPRCITFGDGGRSVPQAMGLRAGAPPILACRYCGRETEAPVVGHRESRIWYRHSAAEVARMNAGNRIYFPSEAAADAAGFRSSSHR